MDAYESNVIHDRERIDYLFNKRLKSDRKGFKADPSWIGRILVGNYEKYRNLLTIL